jgi:hypothetical protein
LELLSDGDKDAACDHQDVIYWREPVRFGFIQKLTTLCLFD